MPVVNETTEDKENGNLPEAIPGVLLLQLNGEQDMLQDWYRKLTDSETVVYFHKKILPKVKGKKKYWEDQKRKYLLSKIYSVSEEAFALLVIDNELDIWNK